MKRAIIGLCCSRTHLVGLHRNLFPLFMIAGLTEQNWDVRLKRFYKYQSSECSVPSVIFFFTFCLFRSVPEGSSVIKLKGKKGPLILGITRQNKVLFF